MPERRAGFGLTARLALAGALLLALVAAAFALLIGAIGTLHDDSRDARRSAEILSAAHRAEKLAIDIETGGRGFVITGDESFLKPWRSGRRQLPRDLVALRRALAGAPAEQALVTELQGQAATYIEDYSAPLVAAARRDRTVAGLTVASKEGKRRVDEMRRLFDRLASAETRRAAAHREAANEAGARAVRLGVILALAVVALLLAAAAFLHRSVIAPVVAVAGAARALGSGNPDARAPERGAAEVGMLAADFNDMAESLQASREALEEQNAQLERQAVELEEHQEDWCRPTRSCARTGTRSSAPRGCWPTRSAARRRCACSPTGSRTHAAPRRWRRSSSTGSRPRSERRPARCTPPSASSSCCSPAAATGRRHCRWPCSAAAPRRPR